MPSITTLAVAGNSIVATYDDDSRQLFAPTSGGFWVPSAGPVNTETGDNGGDGNSNDDDTDPSPTPPTPEDPDPIAPSNGTDLYNPYRAIGISVGGDWDSHIARTGRGGTDYPYGGGTAIKAPAAGTLHISGGSGDYAAGNIGSAGLRSILYLDKTFKRKKKRGRNEGEGPLRAIVFQHQSKFGRAKHYNRGDIIGYTGNTGNGVYHLHVHGLDRGGARLDYVKFF